MPLFNQHQGKEVPTAVGLFPGVDVEAIVPGSLEDIDAAGLHHGPDPEFGYRSSRKPSLRFYRTSGADTARTGSWFNLFGFQRLARSLFLAGRSPTAGAWTLWNQPPV